MELQQLLQEARRERERCLSGSLINTSTAFRNTSEILGLSGRVTNNPTLDDTISRGLPYRRPCENASTQTDQPERVDGLSYVAAATPNPIGTAAYSSSTVPAPNLGWSDADEVAQAEAIQAIKMLSQRAQPPMEEDPSLRGQADIRDASRAQESRPRESALEQVKCLELELDGKDAVIQALERKLAQRDADAQKAQMTIRQLHMQVEAERSTAKASGGGSEYERMRALRMQILELESELERKDLQIMRLSGAARKYRGPFADEESTLCSSEKSEDFVSSANSNAAWRP